MKAIIITTIISVFSITINAQSITGIWNTGKDNTKIEISQFNGAWIGKIKSSDNKQVKIGKIILQKIKKEALKWTGKLYAPKRKEWYDVEISRKINTLELEINAGFFGKTIKWEESE